MEIRNYTRGQRYGIITTTKWHLRDFDPYPLFLVVCSIAERNIVDLLISSIHNVAKLNGRQTQYCLGTTETQEKEKSKLRGSLPSHYHFDAFTQRGVSVKNTVKWGNFGRWGNFGHYKTFVLSNIFCHKDNILVVNMVVKGYLQSVICFKRSLIKLDAIMS